MPTYTIDVNGRKRRVDVPADMPLLWVLRDFFDLTGTKFGCGRGYCGACTVHIEGEARPACQVPVSSVRQDRVTTIEGLDFAGEHPLQRAWRAESVPQCGYCQAGQIMAAAALLARNPDPSDDEIARGLAGNVCRCGTYGRIRRAVRRAAGEA